MSIAPTDIKERIALGEWSAEERDFILNAINHWIDVCALRGREPYAMQRIRKVVDLTPSISDVERVVLRQALDAYSSKRSAMH